MSLRQTFVLTGASRGIGLAVAHFLLKAPEKHNLVVVSRDQSALEKLRSEYPGQVAVLAGDVCDDSIAPKAIDLALSTFGGKLDGVVINHGILKPVTYMAEVDLGELRHAFDVNFFSAVACVKAAIPALRKSGGRIVMVSSGAAVRGVESWGAYGASKAAMNHLAQTLQVEEPDITTIAVRPGRVDTEMQREIREEHSHAMTKEDLKTLVNAYKNGQLLRPDQPGNVIARLVVGASKDLSGKFMTWEDPLLKKYQD